MRRTVDIPLASVVPTARAILGAMGVPETASQGARVDQLVEEALEEFRATASPRGIVADVSADEFAAIYEGDGDNDEPSPLAVIFPRAESLFLFAVTVGAPLSDRVAALFNEGGVALGATLDAAASEGTELAGVYLDGVLLEEARESGSVSDAGAVLRYSPGYCGWNITGQRALFSALGPKDIGITLTESCLMEPLKSISGVVVLGPPEIHEFEDDYSFCSLCRTHDCRRRIQALRS